jgi:hypothetical protein
VRVEIMGSIITRTDWDLPPIPHFCAPMISPRTRS